jgi:hypothetical protein
MAAIAGRARQELEHPAGRLPLLALGFVCLLAGVAGGLARAGFRDAGVLPTAVALHGVVMVSAFFGTVISLERAVALGRLWGYAAPLACGAGGIALVSGAIASGFWLLALGAAVLAAASAVFARRAPSLEAVVLAAGAACLLAGNVSVALGAIPAAVIGWWIAFFALTIGAERLELSRYMPRPRSAQWLFAAIAGALVVSALAPLAWTGVALLALAGWLLAYDIARKTVRSSGLPRYIAVCLLCGYAWLALGGALFAQHAALDAALHAFFVGFVFSMVFGHAPVIVPAVLRRALPYTPWFYLPLALLHASLALRVAAGLAGADVLRAAGSAGNAVAIALFLATAAAQALRRGAQPISQPA